MAKVAGHLSLAELQAGYRTSGDARLARHYQVIWLLAQGRSCAEVALLTSLARRWVEQLLARYNAFGPSSLGDRRRGNGAKATILTPAVLDVLRERLIRPPADQLGTTRSGHQWKPAWPRTRSRSAVRRTHWRATASSRSARVSKCRLTIGSSRWTHSVSAGWSSGV